MNLKEMLNMKGELEGMLYDVDCVLNDIQSLFSEPCLPEELEEDGPEFEEAMVGHLTTLRDFLNTLDL